MAAPVIETIWVEMFELASQETPDGKLILMLATPNGRRYAIPFSPAGREKLRQIVSPVPVFGPGDLPKNGHGAH